MQPRCWVKWEQLCWDWAPLPGLCVSVLCSYKHSAPCCPQVSSVCHVAPSLRFRGRETSPDPGRRMEGWEEEVMAAFSQPPQRHHRRGAAPCLDCSLAWRLPQEVICGVRAQAQVSLGRGDNIWLLGAWGSDLLGSLVPRSLRQKGSSFCAEKCPLLIFRGAASSAPWPLLQGPAPRLCPTQLRREIPSSHCRWTQTPTCTFSLSLQGLIYETQMFLVRLLLSIFIVAGWDQQTFNSAC